MKYLTQILDKRVLAPDGVPIGKVIDTIADMEGRLPAVRAILVRAATGEICLPYDALEFDADPRGPEGSGHIRGDIRLRAPLAELCLVFPMKTTCACAATFWTSRSWTCRITALCASTTCGLPKCGGGYCVVGVDASLRALLRRFEPFHKPIEALARWFRHPLRSNLIAWDDVNTLEPGTSAGAYG